MDIDLLPHFSSDPHLHPLRSCSPRKASGVLPLLQRQHSFGDAPRFIVSVRFLRVYFNV